jgi:hypothetical protein
MRFMEGQSRDLPGYPPRPSFVVWWCLHALLEDVSRAWHERQICCCGIS